MKRYVDFFWQIHLVNKYICLFFQKHIPESWHKDTFIWLTNSLKIFKNTFKNVDKYICKKKLEARLKKVDTDDRYIWKCAPSQQLDICPDSPAHMSNIMFQKLSKFDLCLAIRIAHMYTKILCKKSSTATFI